MFFFRHIMALLFDSMKKSFKAWTDDSIVHVGSEPKLLGYLDKFFTVGAEHNRRLCAISSYFYSIKAIWHCRIIDGIGYKLDLQSIEAIKGMKLPVYVAELCQLIHTCRWMSNSIQNFRKNEASKWNSENGICNCSKSQKSELKIIAFPILSWGM